jgi:DNA-directed RNA polymerase specialized sigma subunit
MINTQGIIQNNSCITDFVKKLKNNKIQYKTLTKKEERDIIEKYISEGKKDELIKLLIMHNIRMVFSIAKHYCKETRDFDNMVAKGLYGLVFAANNFDFFKPITIKQKIGYEIVRNNKFPHNPIIDEETGLIKTKPVYNEIIKIDPQTGKPEYVKFCTYANNWIFKYVMDEFNDRSINIDNNSISIDDKVKIKNSFDNNHTMENYVENMISPDYKYPSTSNELLEKNDLTSFYDTINEFINNTNELTSIEKKVMTDTFYNYKKTKDIAEDLGETAQKIIITKKKALKKIKKYLYKTYNIKNIKDLIC